MPLVAMNQEGERVELWKYSEAGLIKIREAIQGGKKAFCPECGGEMTLKAIGSTHYVAHFAHLPSAESGACGYGVGESQEHLLAKGAIAEYISRFDMYKDAQIMIEYKIDIPNGYKSTRRADVVAIFPNGEMHVHEAQLSAISEQQLGERTNDYRQVSTEVIWWLGGNAKTDTNERWLERNCAIFGSIASTKVKTEIKPVGR
jgi:competence CoiA-like predicted nuclease